MDSQSVPPGAGKPGPVPPGAGKPGPVPPGAGKLGPVQAIASAQIFLSGSPSSAGFDHALALVGKDTPVTLVGQGADGVKLELPSGQAITARGSLPFPENTQLQVRVTVQDGSIRLQILEALPPSPAPILVPLAQGEAAALLRLLQSDDLPDALLPLVRLFAELAPSSEQTLGQAIESLPPQTQRLLASLLGLNESGTAPILRALLERFEPVVSLSEMGSIPLGVQTDFAPSLNGRGTAGAVDNSMELLRGLFLGLCRLDFAAAAEARGQVASPVESLLDELSRILKPLFEGSNEGHGGAGAAETSEKTPHAPKQPPPDAGRAADAGQTEGAAKGQTTAGAAETSEKTQQTMRLPQVPPNVGETADAGQTEGAAKGQTTAGAAETSEKMPQATKQPPPDDGRAADTDQAEGAGRGRGGGTESIGKMVQSLKSLPEMGQIQVTDRTVALALLRLAITVMLGETGGALYDGTGGGTTAAEAPQTGAKDTPAARADSPNIPNAAAPQVVAKDATVAAESPTVADRALESQAKPSEAGRQQTQPGKAIPASGAQGRAPGASGAQGRAPDAMASEIAPEEIRRSARAESVPTEVDGEAGRHPSLGAGKAFPMLGRIAEILKDGEVGGKDGAEAAAKSPIESRGKNVGEALPPAKESASSGAVSKPNAQKPPQLPLASENQRVSANSGTAATASARPDRTTAAEPPTGGLNPHDQPIGARSPASIRDALISQLADALSEAGADVEATARAIHRYLGMTPKNVHGAPPEGGLEQTPEEQVAPARLVQVIERLPVPARRAIASAVLGFPEPDAKKIADTLVQGGGATAARQESVSKLETASPVLRQLTAMATGLPFDAGLEKIATALTGADKGILGAARGVLSLKDGGGQLLDAVDAETKLSGAKRPPLGFEDRIGYLLRFEALNSQQTSPVQDRDGISSWFRSIVDLLIAARAAREPSAAMTAREPAAGGQPDPKQAAAPSQAGYQSGQAQNAPWTAAQAGERPQTWHSWLDGCVRALADPTATKEAAFHSLAAKENVNYFELPLPWMPGRALELWVESDGDGDQKGKSGSKHRVLLGMTFSALGETRVGLESAGKRLNVKIWAEQTKPIENVLPHLCDELSALGFEAAVTLSALVSQGGSAPSIKSALGGQSLNAVG